MFDHPDPETPPIPVEQHPAFAAALRACAQQPVLLDGAPRFLVLRRQFRFGPGLSMISRARIDDATALRDRIAASALSRAPLILAPDHPAPALARIGAVPLMTPASVAELDLVASPDAMLARQHQKWRNRLRHARRQGLKVLRDDGPLRAGHLLIAAEAAQRRARRYRGWPLNLTLAYAGANPGQTALFSASHRGVIVAAMLFLRHGAAATYHIGHTTPEGRALSAHTLLLWQAALWLRDRGHRRLDLGPIDTQHAPGLARFKLGSGARLRRLGGTWGWYPPLGRTLRPLARLDIAGFR